MMSLDGGKLRAGRNKRTAIAIDQPGFVEGIPVHDPQIAIRRIPALFPQGESEDWQATQSRHLQIARGGGKTRTRGAIFQAAIGLVAQGAGAEAIALFHIVFNISIWNALSMMSVGKRVEARVILKRLLNL
jgi:hypothetical protein